MSRAIGWVLVIMLVVLLGTHPGALAGLMAHGLDVLHHAGDELSSFAKKL